MSERRGKGVEALRRPPEATWDGTTREPVTIGSTVLLGSRRFFALRSCYLEPGQDADALARRKDDFEEEVWLPPVSLPRTYVSAVDVGGEQHLLFRTRRPGWRNAVATWLRKHWMRYRHVEGGVLTANVAERPRRMKVRRNRG